MRKQTDTVQNTFVPAEVSCQVDEEYKKNAKSVVQYVYETYGDRVYLSLMNQYTPLPQVKDYPEINRRVTEAEYEELVDYAIDLGVEYGFIQEGETAEESFIPAFDGEGV